MKNCFCTLFDHRYLDRGIALYKSLDRYCDTFELWVLCMDDVCFEILDSVNFSNMRLIKLDQLEKADPSLKKVKEQRTPVEYYFTSKPSLALYVLQQCEQASQVTYMDADIFFFSSPEILYDQLEGKSVAITPHRFAPEMKYMEEFGKFNAGWLLFKRDDVGVACLQWWRERCLEWCHDSPEADRYADQKYIDQFSSLFDGVLSVESVGVNLAPWNIDRKKISYQDKQLLVDGELLVFYHFHNLRSVSTRIFDLGWKTYTSSLNKGCREYIYKPYLSVLLRERERLLFVENPLKRGYEDQNHQESKPKTKLLTRCVKKVRLANKVIKGLREGNFMIGKKAEV